MSQNESIWEPNIENWDSIGIDSYRFILEQAKVRFDEGLIESETLTERGMKITFATMTFAAGLLGISFKAKADDFIVVALTIGYAVTFVLLYLLLYSKKLVLRGSPPIEIFNKSLEKPDYSENDRLSLLYYNEICRYQDRIDKNKTVNAYRQKYYLLCLALTIVLFIATVGYVIHLL